MLSTTNTQDFYDSLNTMNSKDFFLWFKKRVNNEWNGENSWNGGFSEEQVLSFQEKWSITFPPQYKQFLMIVGAPIKHSPHYRWIEEKEAMGYIDLPTFYDWSKDDFYISQALQNVKEGLIFDIKESNLWINSWGEKPETVSECIATFELAFSKAPKLIPLIGHRFLLEDKFLGTNFVLSISQSDIIIYGDDFRRFLIAETPELLNFNQQNAYDYAVKNYDLTDVQTIPFWGDLIS